MSGSERLEASGSGREQEEDEEEVRQDTSGEGGPEPTPPSDFGEREGGGDEGDNGSVEVTPDEIGGGDPTTGRDGGETDTDKGSRDRDTPETDNPDIAGPRGEEGDPGEFTDFAHRDPDSVDTNQGAETSGGRIDGAASDFEQDTLDDLEWTDDPRDIRVTATEQEDGSIQLTTELTESGEVRRAQDLRASIVDNVEAIDHVGDVAVERTDDGLEFSLTERGEQSYDRFLNTAHGADDASGVSPAAGADPGAVMPDEEVVETAVRPGTLDTEGAELASPDTAREQSMVKHIKEDIDEQVRELKGIGAAEEQRRRTLNAGTRGRGRTSEVSEGGELLSGLESVAPGLSTEQALAAVAAPAAATAGFLNKRVDRSDFGPLRLDTETSAAQGDGDLTRRDRSMDAPDIETPGRDFDFDDATMFANLPAATLLDEETSVRDLRLDRETPAAQGDGELTRRDRSMDAPDLDEEEVASGLKKGVKASPMIATLPGSALVDELDRSDLGPLQLDTETSAAQGDGDLTRRDRSTDAPDIETPGRDFDFDDATMFATLPASTLLDDGTSVRDLRLDRETSAAQGDGDLTRRDRSTDAPDLDTGTVLAGLSAAPAFATLPASTLLDERDGDLLAGSDAGARGDGDLTRRGRSTEARGIDPGGVLADLDDFDQTLRDAGTASDPQATPLEEGVRGVVGDPGAGVRERGSGTRAILEGLVAEPSDFQGVATNVGSDLFEEIDPRRDGPIQSQPVTGGPPPGFGLFGGAGALRSAPSYVQALRGSRVAGGASRTGPTGAQLAESIGKQGQFAAQGVEGLLRTGGALGTLGLGLSELDAPESREEFDVEEIATPSDRSEFDVEEVTTPDDRSEFDIEEIGVPEEGNTDQFSELDVPDDLGGAPGSESVVINDDGDVSVVLSASQMFREVEEEEEDELPDVPDEFLPGDDVVIGEVEESPDEFGGMRETEFGDRAEEQEVEWQQPREILSDEPSQTDEHAPGYIDEIAFPSEGSGTVTGTSVGTGPELGGLLDEGMASETSTRERTQPGTDLDVAPGMGQRTRTEPTLAADPEVRAFEAPAESGLPTDFTPRFENPPANKNRFEYRYGGGGGGGLAGPPLGGDLDLGSPSPNDDPRSRDIYEKQFSSPVASPESVLSGDDSLGDGPI